MYLREAIVLEKGCGSRPS